MELLEIYRQYRLTIIISVKNGLSNILRGKPKSSRRVPAALVEAYRGLLKLNLLGRAHRANVRAIAAILALGSVDHVHAALFRDRAFSAFGFASATGEAFIRVNLISHC